MKKAVKVIGIIVAIFFALILLYQCFVNSWTPTFKERNDFNSEEIKVIQEELYFELIDDAKIVNSRFTHARETGYFLWIEGIKDKDDFVKKNSLVFQNNGLYDVCYDIGNNEMQYADFYTTPKDEDIEWYLYEDGNTWSAFLDSSHIGQKTLKLFDKVPNQATRNFS